MYTYNRPRVWFRGIDRFVTGSREISRQGDNLLQQFEVNFFEVGGRGVWQ